MSDVNTFIDTIGKDINATVSPQIERLAQQITATTFDQYGPRVSAFASQLAKDVIAEQSATVRDFATALIQEIFQRYRPELAGELHTRIVAGALEVTGHDVRLDLKRRDTGRGGVVARYPGLADHQGRSPRRDAQERDRHPRRGAIAAARRGGGSSGQSA